MRIRHPLLMKSAGLAVASLTYRWMRTLDYRALYYDQSVDPAHNDFHGPLIFLFWHEYIPFLFYLRGNCNIAMLLSQHHDAEFLSQAARHMGFRTIRGSTTRGGVAVLRALMRSSGTMNLAITPDGPCGPRRRLAQGCIYLSSRLQIPLVAIGLGYDRPWRISRAWDQFAVPRPRSAARGVVSPPLQIPDDLDREGLERYRLRVEKLLNWLTAQAETWAESGERRATEIVIGRTGEMRRRAWVPHILPAAVEWKRAREGRHGNELELFGPPRVGVGSAERD